MLSQQRFFILFLFCFKGFYDEFSLNENVKNLMNCAEVANEKKCFFLSTLNEALKATRTLTTISYRNQIEILFILIHLRLLSLLCDYYAINEVVQKKR